MKNAVPLTAQASRSDRAHSGSIGRYVDRRGCSPQTMKNSGNQSGAIDPSSGSGDRKRTFALGRVQLLDACIVELLAPSADAQPDMIR
jgi:hypothetical protein